MKNRNYSKAKALTLIPVVFFLISVICMVLAAVLEGPSDRGALYSFFALAGLSGIFLSPLPCLIASILGTVFAAGAVKEGVVQARKFLILGIIEILAGAGGVILAAVMFIAGQGV